MRWRPAVHKRLCHMLRTTPPGAVAAFDWDDTCISGDISHALLTDLQGSSGQDLWGPYLKQCQTNRHGAYVQLALTLVAGKTPEQVRSWTKSVMERRVADGQISWSPEIRSLFSAMQGLGWEIWVVTASAQPIVAPLVGEYGLAADRVIGMQPSVLPNGVFGSPVKQATYREGKLRALISRADHPTFAAGDSEGDTHLLEAAQESLLVQSHDHPLTPRAKASNWMQQPSWT